MNKLKASRIFECVVCHRSFKGRQRLFGERYQWTPATHLALAATGSANCLGSYQVAIVLNPEAAAKLPRRKDPPQIMAMIEGLPEGRRELALLSLRLQGEEPNPQKHLFAMIDCMVKAYVAEKAREQAGAALDQFVAWLAERSITLRPWQSLIAALFFAQPGAAGKTSLLWWLSSYEREGNG